MIAAALVTTPALLVIPSITADRAPQVAVLEDPGHQAVGGAHGEQVEPDGKGRNLHDR